MAYTTLNKMVTVFINNYTIYSYYNILCCCLSRFSAGSTQLRPANTQ